MMADAMPVNWTASHSRELGESVSNPAAVLNPRPRDGPATRTAASRRSPGFGKVVAKQEPRG